MIPSGCQALLRNRPKIWKLSLPSGTAATRGTRRLLTIATEDPPLKTPPCRPVSLSAVASFPLKSCLAGQPVKYFSFKAGFDVQEASKTKIESLSKNDLRRVVTVRWSDGEQQHYPYIWLLDNCRCSDCYHTESQGRLLSFVDLDITARPESVETINYGDAIRVSWNPHHHSDFNSDWLRTFRFDEERGDEALPLPKLWGAEVAESLPKFEFDSVLSDEKILFDFLKAFCEFGILKLLGAPAKPDQIPIIAKRIGLMRDTSFGVIQPLKIGGHRVENLELYRVLSYTNKGLQLHTDMACLTEPTCMAFFHCIDPSKDKGGHSTYSDGFKAAETLRRVDPGAFQTLCTIQHEFRLAGMEPGVGTFDHRCYHRPITLDHFGRLKAIHYSNHGRLPSLRMPVDGVQAMYSALQSFVGLIESPENVLQVSLKKGEMMIVNNHRVLHGRTPFSDSSGRHLELGYVDWDHVTSRMRVLQNRLNGSRM